ncbi:hypothetical protein [Ferrovibrio sp.]|uniref:hypothetical protein n=1 Tax=Ferrovibrio sp. TaxID=1917215 RepID=UPI003D2A8539
MTTNLSRYEADLEKLIKKGELLLTVMQYEQNTDQVKKQIHEIMGGNADKFIADLPRFSSDYQFWYSEAKALVRQVIPDRLADFVRHYERQPNRKVMQWDNYTIEDYLQGLSRSNLVPMSAGLACMEQQLNIVKSAQQKFKSSLFDIRQLVTADLFDSEIDAARLLLKNKFLRAAGAVAGVVLEKHLAHVCDSHNIKNSKKNPTINDLNDLLKNADVIDMPRWRANQHLADIRNICDHNKSKEPTVEQVADLIDGTEKVIKTIF